jgi:hypothetical protein
MKAKKVFILLAAIVVAAPAFAHWTTPVDPNDTTTSGAGRALVGGLPTPADPLGTNSVVGRAIAQAPAPSPTNPENPISGTDRAVAGGWPTPVDPNGPNSGAGRALTAFPSPVDPYGTTTSGAGRALATFPNIVDPTWPKPNSGAGRILS